MFSGSFVDPSFISLLALFLCGLMTFFSGMLRSFLITFCVTVPRGWKRSVFIPIPKKGNAKECSNYCTIALISHTTKVIFKILQARLQQYVNHELPDVQAGFTKGRGARDQIAHIGSSKKQESSRKMSTSGLLTISKPLIVWITTNCGKFFKR